MATSQFRSTASLSSDYHINALTAQLTHSEIYLLSAPSKQQLYISPLMSRSILLSQFFLPISAIRLGRFVISFDDPHHDFYDPICATNLDVAEKVHTQFNDNLHSTRHHNGGLKLTGFLSSSFSKRLHSSMRVTADEAKTYYLNNGGQWFRDAVKSEETRKWIERTIDEGEDIYIVVAYHTLLNARIVEQLQWQGAAGGTLTIPVSTALAASGVVVPFTEAVDPGFGGSRGTMENEQRQFRAPGEQVYAVKYRKVRWSWFSSKKVDKMALSKKAWWESYDRSRYLDAKIEDSIEVELEDEMDLEGDMDECVLESGEALVSAA
jgi:hypothetical protein